MKNIQQQSTGIISYPHLQEKNGVTSATVKAKFSNNLRHISVARFDQLCHDLRVLMPDAEVEIRRSGKSPYVALCFKTSSNQIITERARLLKNEIRKKIDVDLELQQESARAA